ncbi:MAG: hypothetical protein AAGC96_17320 [Pseudomonadota bacterium]
MASGTAKADDQIDWNSYMQSAPVVAAIASAIAHVDHCSVRPLLIEEIVSGENKRTLVFTCNGNEDEEGSAILQLERFGDSDWMPVGFEYAG